MSYLEELLPEFRKGAKIRCKGWDEDIYIEMKKGVGFVSNNKGRKYIFTHEDFNHACWEFYQEPEPDWNYIIKNKCLCWFWNADNDNKEFGLLGKVYNNLDEGDYKFYKKFEQNFKYCRPVRRDEVTFYEDRKDD